MAGVLAGLQSSVQASNKTARWADRDTAAKHEVLYGDRGKGAMSEAGGDDVPDIRLGDEQHNYPAPVVVTGGGNNGGNSLLTLALGAALGGGGIFLGQMLSKPVTPSVTPSGTQQSVGQDTTTTIGLGRIEDYLKAGAK